MRHGATALLLALALLAACRERQGPGGAVLATYRGGTITQGELDATITALPAAQRRPAGDDPAAWQENLLRELAAREILLERAAEVDLARDPVVQRRLVDIDHEAVAGAYLERRVAQPPAPAEDELRSAYDRWKDRLVTPERRQVFHIFRRVEPGAPAEPARLDMERLRARALQGELFQDLAAGASDSETRHRHGFMGWFARGELDPRLEEVVFALPERTPSEPIRTGTGYHLFWVDDIVPAAEYSFAEARGKVAQWLQRERRLQHARARLDVEAPAGSFLPSPEDVLVLLRSGEPGALLLKVGDFELHLRDLHQKIAEAEAEGQSVIPIDLVEVLEMRELLVLQAQREGFELDAAEAARAERLAQAALSSEAARRLLLDRIRADRAALEAHFERSRMRYVEPLRLHLERALFPFGEDPNALMARLEAARPDLDAGTTNLAALAAELGGRVEDLGWKTSSELPRETRASLQLLAGLPGGGHSPPFRRGEVIEVVRVAARQEPAPVPLARVEDEVAADILASRGQQLYAELVRELLAERRFRVLAPPPAGAAEEPSDQAVLDSQGPGA